MFDDVTLDGIGIAVMVILLVVMVLAVVAVNVVPRLVHKWEISYGTRDLTYGAACLAMSYALSWAALFRMPQGGTVTPAALAPIFIYCYYFGFRKGMIISGAYTLLQFTQGVYIVSPWSAFFDYILPCFALCIVGLFRYKPERYAAFVRRSKKSDGFKGKVGYWAHTVAGHWGIFAGASLHMIVRYLSSCLSGLLFFSDAGVSLAANLAYTFSYNSVLLVDSAIALAAVLILMSSRTFNIFMQTSFDDKNARARALALLDGDEQENAPVSDETSEASADANAVRCEQATACDDDNSSRNEDTAEPGQSARPEAEKPTAE